MMFAKNPPLPLLICPTCHGTGYLGFSQCKNCKGRNVGHKIRSKFLYWGEPLTPYHIRVRILRRFMNRLHIVGGLLFGLAFLLLFFYVVYRRDLFDQLLLRSFWLETGNSVTTLFWLSIAGFCYLLYRSIVIRPHPTLVEQKAYGAGVDLDREEDVALVSWDAIKKLKRKERLDVADVYTLEARAILEEAYRIAEKHGHTEVTALHVFFALLFNQKISMLFLRLGVAQSVVQAKVAQLFSPDNAESRPHITDEFYQLVFGAYERAYQLRQEVVHVSELLLASVEQSEPVQEMLYDMNVDKTKLENVVSWLRIREKLRRQHQRFAKAAARRSKYGLDRAMTAVATPFLNSFSSDLTMSAKFGQLAPCVAREKEIEEMFRVIEGGRQSVVLVGEHGVGKMSIVEGIAQKMVEDDVPDRLKDKRLVQLSTSALLAGTTVSGAEERLIGIMNEVARAGNIILFINNIHDLVGSTAGSGGEGLDVSDSLSEFLGSDQFLTLATTTAEGYNRHILNSEIGTVLSRVDVKEMEDNQAIQVLESKVGVVEYKHTIFFLYDALAACVSHARKFLHDQRLPESALSIMTEAASYVHNSRGKNHLVGREDVAAIVSEKTGIPMTSISEDESAKLLRLEEAMHERVIGQNEAVVLVANALRRARAEIRSESRPIANFLFLGPTGVGKTELAKTIANVYFGGEERMVRIDMSEYQDKSAIYRMIGQPGQQGTGILTEAVRQQPFSLVLLDEMEKADPDVLNLFLQVFDDGRLTDSVGRVIDFTNTIIIATSNAGTQYVQDEIQAGKGLEDIRQSLIHGKLKEYYRPEFLNRFDGIVLFQPLERDDIKKVAGLMLKGVEKDLEKRGVFLRVEDAGLEALAEVGFDPEFGARPMRRAIQDRIENALAELILGGKLKRRDTIVIGEGAEIRVERV